MAAIDLAHLRSWIGRVQDDEDVLSVRHARLMAATVGHAADARVEGAPLPALWHWLYFLEGRPPANLGATASWRAAASRRRCRCRTACGPAGGSRW